MPKKEKIKMKGKVSELLRGARFRVELDDIVGENKEIITYLAGKMKINQIKVGVGDTVQVEISPYDLTKGRIIYRY